jgi:DNA-directed RNA polymerase specialized sigma24 family protein
MSSTPQRPVDEPALVAGAEINPATFYILYDLYFRRIHKYVRLRVDDPQTADDLVSQIFERMNNNIKNYRPNQAPFSAWLFGIARHMVGGCSDDTGSRSTRSVGL